MYISLSLNNSYSSASAFVRPLDIQPSDSIRDHDAVVRADAASCAFPSWPRRPSLTLREGVSGPAADNHGSAFITDEELFPMVFDEHDCTPPASLLHTSRSPASPNHAGEPHRVVVSHAVLMRELMAQDKARKERRMRSKNSGSKKTRSSSGGSKHMSPIRE